MAENAPGLHWVEKCYDGYTRVYRLVSDWSDRSITSVSFHNNVWHRGPYRLPAAGSKTEAQIKAVEASIRDSERLTEALRAEVKRLKGAGRAIT